MVARRLVPLLVAVAVAFAPVALVACRVSCAHANMQAYADSAHHHHQVAKSTAASTPTTGHIHEHASSASIPASSEVVMGGPHSCDHESAIVPGLLSGSKAASDHQLAPVAILPSPACGTSHTSAAAVNWLHPPGDRIDRSSLTTVLRI